jgi:hypothetical protein
MSLAKVTFICFFNFRTKKNHIYGAVLGTEPTANASVLINLNNALIRPLNGLDRADIHAIGIFALVADHRDMIQVFLFLLNPQPGQSRIVSLKQVKGTCQLAYAASGAFVKICMNKRFNDTTLFLLFTKKDLGWPFGHPKES